MQSFEDNENGENGEEYEDEQIEQMIIESGLLIRSLGNLLVKKGVLRQEEIDEEMDRLYDEMEEMEEAEEE